MEALLTAWIPSLLIQKTIPVRDAHIIAQEARGRSRLEAETMNHKYFPCVSLGGDLYWRGGWFGVIVGSSIAAIAYRLICWIWYRQASWDSAWQILLLIFPATFLTMFPAGSVGETAWLWMWDSDLYHRDPCNPPCTPGIFVYGFVTSSCPRGRTMRDESRETILCSTRTLIKHLTSYEPARARGRGGWCILVLVLQRSPSALLSSA